MSLKKPTFQPIIKWSGSKRKVAYQIKDLAPNNFNSYFETFIGGGSVLYAMDANKKVASDINKPLIDLWNLIKTDPDYLLKIYTKYWHRLNEEGNPDAYKTFYEIRDDYNAQYKPEDLFFLSRTCVNGLIRFNKQGEFNNSLHYTRKGINPKNLTNILSYWSKKIQNTEFLHLDYRDTVGLLRKNGVVYLDPPYFHTKGMYYGAIDMEDFLNYLEILNKKGVHYLLSFDGRTSLKDYTFDMPDGLYKRHQYIYTGQSTFKKVIDKKENKVYESIYMNY